MGEKKSQKHGACWSGEGSACTVCGKIGAGGAAAVVRAKAIPGTWGHDAVSEGAKCVATIHRPVNVKSLMYTLHVLQLAVGWIFITAHFALHIP